MDLTRGRAAPAPARHRRPTSVFARVLMVAGLLVLIGFMADIAAGLWQARQLDDSFRRQVPAPAAAPATGAAVQAQPVDGVDFAIRVPKLGYFAAVAEGVDSHTLAGGPGHYPGMAWPGQPGNVGVAAHNVYWIHFDELQPGDQVELETRWGTYTYAVTGKRIVWPEDRSILVSSGPPRLTLTTCWPLWAGAFATQRLVIFADQVDPPTHGA